MQITNNTTWLISLKRNAVRLLSLVILLGCAILLTTYTVGLQNSCNPLLDWTTASTRHCPSDHPNKPPKPPNPKPDPGPEGSDNSSKGKGSSQSKDQPPIDKHDKTPPDNTGKSPDNTGKPPDNTGKVVKEVAGVAAGSIAVVGMAVVEAPVLAAAGVGIAVWLAFRTLFPSDG